MPDVLITGAARGLGRAMAEHLAARGFRVAAADLDVAALAGLDAALALELDVTDPASAARAAERVRAAWGGLDGLVNNAGIEGVGSVVATPVEIGRRVMDVNLAGVYVVTNAMLPLLHARRGRVIVLGSEAARFPQPFSLYTVSKIGVEAWAAALRQELRLEGMRVSIVRPGAHGTGLLGAVRESFVTRSSDPILGRWLPRVGAIAERELHRAADPSDVAAAVHRALTARFPRRVYPVNNSLTLRAAQLVPAPARERIARLVLRLARPARGG